MKPFWAALRFLTILPLPEVESDGRDLSRSAMYFPLVGLLLGLAVAAFDHFIVARIFPPLPASGIIVVALVAVSGGLHMDGLADAADGLLSSRPRERALEIMRDSRTGAMGVVAVVCVIGLKFASLASVPPSARWTLVLMMPLAGRCALTILMALQPYARAEGLATVFRTERPAVAVMWAVFLLLTIGWISGGQTGFIASLVALSGTLLFARYTTFRLGGHTGDTLGAGCEIVEMLVALSAAATL
ncbi:MAG: adenosylcobinamide-GDP ribazoletransferase [Candidatus Abyssubacteria bacterium]